MLKGRIININSSNYTVIAKDKKYVCTVRGVFREKKVTPLVGDNVVINVKDRQIIEILKRKNQLQRPSVANIDMSLIMVSVKKPNLDLLLLDKLLVHSLASKITPIICFTKCDLLNDDEYEKIKEIKKYYKQIGFEVIENTESSYFKKLVSGKTVVCAGQTGSGKSTFINKIDSTLDLKTAPISKALGRGVHTTRFNSIYKVDDFYIVDTPGFSALDFDNIDKEVIKDCFIEFNNYTCKYTGCYHINIDGCGIEGNKNILPSRYKNYKRFIKEKNESSSKFFKKR